MDNKPLSSEVTKLDIPEQRGGPEPDTINIRSISLTGLFVLAVFYTLYFAREMFLPITAVLLLNFVFRPVLRALKKFHIPNAAGAGIVVAALMAIIAVGALELSQPASQWLSEVPSSLPQIERKVRELLKPVQKVSKAAEQVQNLTSPNQQNENVAVQMQGPSLIKTVLSETQKLVVWSALMLLLLFFMLAYGDIFLRKLIKVHPRFEDKKRVLDIANDIERQVSVYLFTVTLLNTATGVVIGAAFYFIGLPNAVLWGVMVALLEYIPYLGPLTGIVIISIVGLLTFDSVAHALLAPLAYLIIDTVQGNLVATIIFGRRFSLNPVVILVWLTFWTWLWGVPGTLLAVPMLTAFKIFCDHIEPLSTIGEFIGS